ncbi:hypothetical protein ACFQ36_11840 [Arthrobacter sp. GCM10027362]|uniref:HNH endonuclease n=1 Tax=Arthrobacter sp. GCM10027362 TaxID=3273379 RepID=UPI00362A2758
MSGSFLAELEHLSPRQTASLLAAVEEVSRAVEFFQAAGAWAVERADIARVGECGGFFGDSVAHAGAGGAAEATWANPAGSFGGHKAQVMITIGYRKLAGEVAGSGYPVFDAPLNPGTVRRPACDADTIPGVLGSSGEVLDVGRASRFFLPALRRALIARDRGCAFPGCAMPAVWTEARHIVPWWRGGKTKASNGCLLCIFHRDLIDESDWEIVVEAGMPWFIPPAYVDPKRRR